MSQTSPGSADDKRFETTKLFRDVSADVARRRDAAATGEAWTVTADQQKLIDAFRWREAALSSARDVDEIWDWLFRAMGQNTTLTGPACLAAIQTKSQLKDFLLELLFPDLVEIIKGVIEGMQHEGNNVARKSKKGRDRIGRSENRPDDETESEWDAYFDGDDADGPHIPYE